MKLSTFLTVCFVPFLLTAAAATAQPPGGPQGRGRPPGTEFDEEMTPLQKAIMTAVDQRGPGRERPGVTMRKCANPGRACEPSPRGQGSEEIRDPQGRAIGKRIRTQTVLDYQNRRQRDGHDGSWDRVMIAGPMMGGRVGANAGNPSGGRSRRAVMFPDRATNDDGDCFDRALERQNRILGEERYPSWRSQDECFDAAGNLVANLRPLGEGCEHVPTGLFLPGDPTDGLEDDCYDENDVFKETSLEELVDEDPPQGLDNDGDGRFGEDPPGNGNEDMDCLDTTGRVLTRDDCFVNGELREDRFELVDEDGPDDLDGDGQFGEDPPAQETAEACTDFGMESGLPPGLGEMGDEEECDLTRAVIVAANQKALDQHGYRIYAADDQGRPMDPGDPDFEGVPFGGEERRVTLNETFALMCPEEGAEMTEDGRCALPASPPARLATASAKSAETAGFDGSQTHQAMMGFTFAPPVIEWGYEISEEACVIGICVEIFNARVGYEFDVAAGLRLPIEVTVSGLPDTCRDGLEPPCALAGDAVTLTTAVEPLDFTVAQYRQFCEENGVADGTIIADCDRFAVPEYIDSRVPDSLIPALNDVLSGLGLAEFERDGAELVAREQVFAGARVTVAGIRLFLWGIDSEVDLPAMCTIYQIVEALKDPTSSVTLLDLAQLGRDAAATGEVLMGLRELIPNCQSFTTPFGLDEDGSQRTFPFTDIPVLDVRADCAESLAVGDFVVIDGVPVPICTGLILGVHGASLGVGLGLDIGAGSNLITAEWSRSGDAVRPPGEDEQLRYVSEVDIGFPVEEDTELELRADNYDNGIPNDRAAVAVDDFVYYLNTLELILRADLEFGGILAPIPDLASFEVFSLTLSAGTFGLPIPEHPGTQPITTGFFVENYGLDVDGYAATDNPERAADDTLRIEPGTFGEYLVAVNNLGSVSGDFDNFTCDLSNRIQDLASGELTFVIDPDTDGDGLVDEDPPGPVGALPEEQDEDGDGIVNEDPPENWQARIVGAEILEVASHSWSTGGPPPTGGGASQVLVLEVSPFRHFLTAPGLYPVRIAADSRQARLLGLDRRDPSGNFRLGASDQHPGAHDVVWIEVTPFSAPEIALQPLATQSKPGIEETYTAAGTNGSNVPDALDVESDQIDWNPAGCTLTTLGSQPGCPFRAVPTAIDEAWTTLRFFPDQFQSPSGGLLGPGEFQDASFTLLVPRDWSGMVDTTYELRMIVTSQEDTDSPPASSQVVMTHTVTATSESMTRYIGLEIRELAGKIEAANGAGIGTGGLLPIALHPAALTNDRALGRVLAGNLDAATRAHSSNIRIMEGFLHALDGIAKRLPPELVGDWRAQGQAIVSDLETAAANTIASAEP